MVRTQNLRHPILGQVRLPTNAKAKVAKTLTRRPWKPSRPTAGLQHSRGKAGQLSVVLQMSRMTSEIPPDPPWKAVTFHSRADSITAHWS